MGNNNIARYKEEGRILSEMMQEDNLPISDKGSDINKISHRENVDVGKLTSVVIDEETRERIARNMTINDKKYHKVQAEIAQKITVLLEQSKKKLNEELKAFHLALNKELGGGELYKEKQYKVSKTIFFQQSLAVLLYEYLIKDKAPIGTNEIQSMLQSFDLYSDQANIAGIISHALALGFFLQPCFRENYIVLDFRALKEFSVLLDQYCKTDIVVVDKGYALKNGFEQVPVYCIDVKSTSRSRKGFVTINGINEDFLSQKTGVEVYQAFEQHLYKLLDRGLDHNARRDKTMKQYREDVGSFPQGNYKLWHMTMTTGLVFEDWGKYSHERDIKNLYSQLRVAMKEKFLQPNNLL